MGIKYWISTIRLVGVLISAHTGFPLLARIRGRRNYVLTMATCDGASREASPLAGEKNLQGRGPNNATAGTSIIAKTMAPK